MENASQVRLVEMREIWKRGLFMLLFAIAFNIGQMILTMTAIVQFIWLLATREHNEYLARFGASLSNWFTDPELCQRGQAVPLAALALTVPDGHDRLINRTRSHETMSILRDASLPGFRWRRHGG